MTTPSMTPISELGIIGATIDNKNYDIHTRTSLASPVSSRKGSLRTYFSNVKKAILNRPDDFRSDTWCVPVTLVADKGGQHKWEAVAALDSQCRENLVSSRAVQREHLDIEKIDRWHLANTITGQAIYCLGYIDMKLYCKVKIKSMLGREPVFQPRYYNMRFLVVESDNFELIVGHRTMEEENIYRDKDLICFTAPAVGASATLQLPAAERRRLERIRMDEHKKRMNEEQEQDQNSSI